MTEVNISKNVYVYGKFYDSSKVQIPKDKYYYDVIIYAQPFNEVNRVISSLEGLFVSEIPLIEKGKDNTIMTDWNPLCRRDEMKFFEEKYKGKFIPFGE